MCICRGVSWITNNGGGGSTNVNDLFIRPNTPMKTLLCWIIVGFASTNSYLQKHVYVIGSDGELCGEQDRAFHFVLPDPGCYTHLLNYVGDENITCVYREAFIIYDS